MFFFFLPACLTVLVREQWLFWGGEGGILFLVWYIMGNKSQANRMDRGEMPKSRAPKRKFETQELLSSFL